MEKERDSEDRPQANDSPIMRYMMITFVILTYVAIFLKVVFF